MRDYERLLSADCPDLDGNTCPDREVRGCIVGREPRMIADRNGSTAGI
jgi:hypothetical protein